MNDVLPPLRSYVHDKFLVKKEIDSLSDEDPLLESGIVDSMGILELVSFIESEYGIVVEDEEIVPDTFSSMASIASFVEAKRTRTSA